MPKILAVDDERMSLEIIRCNLQPQGYEIITAEDGTQACEKLYKDPSIDLLLLDRMMPGKTGIQVLKELRADERFKNLPIVVQSADAYRQHIKEAMDAGASEYLVKPYTSQMIVDLIDALLGKKAAS